MAPNSYCLSLLTFIFVSLFLSHILKFEGKESYWLSVLHKNYSQSYQLKTRFIFSQFLRVKNLGVAQLESSESGSLMRLQPVCQPGLPAPERSSDTWGVCLQAHLVTVERRLAPCRVDFCTELLTAWQRASREMSDLSQTRRRCAGGRAVSYSLTSEASPVLSALSCGSPRGSPRVQCQAAGTRGGLLEVGCRRPYAAPSRPEVFSETRGLVAVCELSLSRSEE